MDRENGDRSPGRRFTRSDPRESKEVRINDEVFTRPPGPFDAGEPPARSGVRPRRVEDLAIFTGSPAFSRPLHVGTPNLGDRKRLVERIEDILDRRWFTNDGVYVREFERRVADLLGVKHVVAMCNGTIALEITIRAIGLEGEVIVPSNTFVATAHALQWQQIKPVFADIDPRTHNLDPARIEALITPKTTGILAVHLWGRGADVEGLEAVARRRGLALVFDAAHAFACSWRGRMIGGFGRAECFSFHATKFCSSFEGGAVTTNNGDLAEKMRLMRNFGFKGLDDVGYIGSNGKMSEVAAAMGLTSLESREAFIAASRANYRLYRELLGRIPGLTVLEYDEAERNNYHYIVVEVDAARTGLERDLLVRMLRAENVLARRYFYPGAHRMEPYRSHQPQAGLVLPVTEQVLARVMQLPTGTAIGEAEVRGIASIIALCCAHGRELASRLSDGPTAPEQGTLR
jgi:dTDP-4-amino-4,6-dideoxygalactose transaminase